MLKPQSDKRSMIHLNFINCTPAPPSSAFDELLCNELALHFIDISKYKRKRATKNKKNQRHVYQLLNGIHKMMYFMFGLRYDS